MRLVDIEPVINGWKNAVEDTKKSAENLRKIKTKESQNKAIIEEGIADFLNGLVSDLEKAPFTKEKFYPVWKNPQKEPPEVETEVLVLYRRDNYLGITTALYEDGSVFSEDSEWNWECLPDWGTYDEERDGYRIPEGWWEYRHFNSDDIYNSGIDCPVVGWMPLPPKGERK